jgi:hypothetical protein
MRTTEIDIGKMTNNAEDKMKAGATAAANKIANTAKDLKAEYYKKKMEEHAYPSIQISHLFSPFLFLRVT